MKLEFDFKESDQSFKLDFGQVQTASDGGYDRGYAEGYEVGSTDGKAEGYTQGHEDGYTDGKTDGYTEGHQVGYTDGYDVGYETGEALLIQSKPSRIENDVATSIRASAFAGDTSTPTYVSFKNAKSIGASAFSNCRGLKEAYFGSVTSIGNSAFYLCQALVTLVIRTPSVCKLSAAMSNNSIVTGSGYIYVPAALVDSYKAATNWSTHANKIRAIEDYPDITGG